MARPRSAVATASQQQLVPILLLVVASSMLVSGATATSLSSHGQGHGHGSEHPKPPPHCPPKQLQPLKDFDLRAYIAAPWYVQKQIPLSYQPVNELYCVKAQYDWVDRRNISAGVIVSNYNNKGRVNGPANGTSKFDRTNNPFLALRGFPATPGAAARDGQLLVGPAALLKLLPGGAWRSAFGPYWVVAVGKSKKRTLGYDWAIISGGAPVYGSPQGRGCSSVPYSHSGKPTFTSTTTTTGGGSGGKPMLPAIEEGGLWFFSRKKTDPRATAKMERVARDLGFDTSQQLPVQQHGCHYKF